VTISNTVSGTVPAPREVIAVLIVARAALERAVRDALPIDHCELTSTADTDTALAALDQLAPDAVLVEADLLAAAGASLVKALRGARAAGVHAVIALAPDAAADDAERARLDALMTSSGVDAVVRMPLNAARLYERLLRCTGRLPGPPFGREAIGSGTVDEIARGVAEEIRRGIADSLRVGRAEHIELEDRSELLAAAWSAVARIRQHLAESAAGRVRFDDAPYPDGPAALALTDDVPAAPYVGVGDTIRGRRVVLADDDPAVLWFFAGLLREAGAIAIETRNGKQALEEVRRRPPDLLISDILMPEVDGFSLCRELKRDLILSHVPVILLSWKEDFLQRMRELDAGASGYLRKEAGSLQILVTVADALRPRAELHALLAAEGEVQGRIDAVGVPALLRAVAAQRGDACVTVRDAWNLFEIDVRNGTGLRVTRTAADGSFVRGRVALRQLFGVQVGRFRVEYQSAPVRGMFAEPLDSLLADEMSDLAAMLDAVSDSRLLGIARIGFDDEILGPLLTATPTALADAAARMRAGEAPKQLVLSGAYAARELEQHLRELARRGAIAGVWGEGDEDLVEAARRRREDEPGALLHAAERPSRPFGKAIVLGEDDVEIGEQRETKPPPTMPPLAPGRSLQPKASESVSEPEPEPESEPGSDSEPEPESEPGSEPGSEPVHVGASQRARPSDPPQPFRVQSALLDGGAEALASRAGTRSSRAPSPVPSSRAPAPPTRSALPSLAIGVAALIAIGFFGWRALSPRRADVRPRPSSTTAAAAPSPQPTAAASPPSSTATTAAPSTTAPSTTAAAPPSDGEPPRASSSLGRVLPFVDRSRGVQVAADQGLLVVQFDGAGSAPRVVADGRDLGAVPVAAALGAGRHELIIKRGDRNSVRYFVLRAGETRIVELRD
jgi:CheY-like chemotaxis protein